MDLAQQQPKTVAVIGTGTIGASWATLFLASGLKVRASDPAPGAESRLRAFVSDAWPAMVELGKVEVGGLESAQSALFFSPSVEEAASGVDLVQENASERIEIKRETYAKLESALDSSTIIASSTSGIMPSALQEKMAHPERLVVGHPFNPPHLIPLVEVVPGQKTSETVVEAVTAFYRSIGKQPIRLRREVAGHIANRLQVALWREVVHLAREGVASVEDIDLAVSAGPGLRWSIMGPSMIFNLNGGPGGMAHFLAHLGPAVEAWWADLGTPKLDETTQKIFTEAFSAFDSSRVEQAVEYRDQMLLQLLRMLDLNQGGH